MAYQVFETSILNRKLGAESRMLFVPRDVAEEVIEQPEALRMSVLGVRLGVRIPDEAGLVDVLYAGLQGRAYTFDAGSFRRWRDRWQADSSEASLFAQELVFGDRVPVSQSPLQLASLASLWARGESYVAGGAEWIFDNPVQTLGLVVLVEGAVLVVSLGRAARQTLVIAAK